MKISLVFSLSGILMISNASAVVLLSEDFSYPDGSLVPNGAWENHSGTAGDLLIVGGAAVVQHGTPSEDANVLFGTADSGVLTATFDVVVSDDAAIGGGDYEYFAHFMTRGTSTFRAKLDIVEPTGGGDYTFGIASSANISDATLATDFSFGNTVSLSISFDFATGEASLTVGSETITGAGLGAGQSLDAFGLRQSDSSNNEAITVDNLVISDNSVVPEPSTALLGGLALLGLLGRRRA